MKLKGKIVAADSTDKTITIQCDTSISGVQISGRVILQDEWPEPNPKDDKPAKDLKDWNKSV